MRASNQSEGDRQLVAFILARQDEVHCPACGKNQFVA